MDLSQISIERFLCEPDTIRAPAPDLDFSNYDQIFSGMVGSFIGDLGQGYVLHRLDRNGADVALLCEGVTVGYYHGEILTIAKGHRNKRLSIPMILAAVEHRPLPEKRSVSEFGEKALRRAWAVANDKAPNPWPHIDKSDEVSSALDHPSSDESSDL